MALDFSTLKKVYSGIGGSGHGLYKGVKNESTGKYEYAFEFNSNSAPNIRADLYTRTGLCPRNGDTIFYDFISGSEVPNTKGRTISIQSPERMVERGLPNRGDDVFAVPNYTDYREAHYTDDWIDDFNPLIEPRHTGKDAEKFGNFAFPPTPSGDIGPVILAYRNEHEELLKSEKLKQFHNVTVWVNKQFARANLYSLDGQKPTDENLETIGDIFDVWAYIPKTVGSELLSGAIPIINSNSVNHIARLNIPKEKFTGKSGNVLYKDSSSVNGTVIEIIE
jgi:hypothetical protein